MEPTIHSFHSRRKFLAAAGGILLAGSLVVPAEEREEEEVSPGEDLMREHGVLKRVLLIYEEVLRRMDGGHDWPPDALESAAQIVRTFIEDYHEKLEEDQLFPRFEKAGRMTGLVETLRLQHQKGRQLTDLTLSLSKTAPNGQTAEPRKLAEAMRQFRRMYEPHEAREDTVLFPAFKRLVSKNEYDSLGEDFEKKEHALFGEDGFDSMVERVAGIEKTLGIFDLKQFTPDMV